MKNQALFLTILLGGASTFPLHAQTNFANAPFTATNYAVSARTPYSRQWVKILSQTNADGSVTSQTNKAYTELGTGLCVTNAAGQLADADESIQIVADGAESTQTQHKVHWAGNINSRGGAVRLVSPGGKVFRSRVYGLSYWDTAQNTNILLAALQDSQGQLVSSNRIVYSNAFDHLQADIEYLQRKSGLEQNIILRQNLPSPTNFGLNPQSTRLEVLTEFFSPPSATTTKVTRQGIQEDTVINFGDLTIGMGMAFKTGTASAPLQQSRLGSVSKHWGKIQGRDFLVEEIPYQTISNAVQALPPQAAVTNAAAEAIRRTAALLPLRPVNTIADAPPRPILLAQATTEKPGVVIDYTTLDQGTDGFEFQSGVTYFVTSEFYAADPVIDGGTVIKCLDPNCWCICAAYYGANPLVFNSTPDQPAVITSGNDDSVGDQIQGSSGQPASGDYGVGLCNAVTTPNNSFTVNSVKFCYAGIAYWDYSENADTFQDCQFVQCSVGIEGECAPTNIYLKNDLFIGAPGADGPTDIAIWGDEPGFSVFAEQVTMDGMAVLLPTGWNDYLQTPEFSYYGGLTNCIFTGCDGSEQALYEDSTADLSSSDGVYATGGDNHYYLPVNSPYHGVGDPNISPDTLAGIQQSTTYTPQDGSWPDTGEMPDLGFHYPTNTSLIDGVPDSWEMAWFGTCGYLGNDHLYEPQSLLYLYQNNLPPIGTDPIQFTLSVTNLYVNQNPVPVQINLQSGNPLFYAVLVNDTNADDAVWEPYTSSTLWIGLGPSDGADTITVGLNNSYSNTPPVWQKLILHRLTSRPQLALTNPAATTVDQPVIQVQGYCPTPLASLNYWVASATGGAPLQPAVILSQYFDTNSWQFTTNTFQAFDVPLTLGANWITFEATDVAGNATTTTLEYVLDYSSKTNPPEVNVYWPMNGSQICGSSFTLRGAVADPTVTLSAQIVDSDGDTNQASAIVERNGNFWVENLPLAAGTNFLTLTATDATGTNVTTTNLSVVQSSVGLAFSSIPGLAGQTPLTVTGTISAGNYTVWVNGVAATQSGSAPYISWTATNVPVNGFGTAVIQALAITNSDNGGQGGGGGGGGTNSSLQNPGNPTPDFASPEIEADPDQPDGLLLVEYHYYSASNWVVAGFQGNYTNFATEQRDGYLNGPAEDDSAGWTYYEESGGGDWYTDIHGNTLYFSGDGFLFEWRQWSVDALGNVRNRGGLSTTNNDYSFVLYEDDDELGMASPNNAGFYGNCITWYDNEGYADYDYIPSPGNENICRQEASFQLQTGGKSAGASLFQEYAGAQDESGPPVLGTGAPIPNADIWLNDPPLTTNGIYPGFAFDGSGITGSIFAAEPNGAAVALPVSVQGFNGANVEVGESKIPVTLTANGIDLSTNTPTFYVGEQVTFRLTIGKAYTNVDVKWSLPQSCINYTNQLNWKTSPTYGFNTELEEYSTNGTPVTQCWFYAKPGGNVSVAYTIHLQDGTVITNSQQGSIDISGPSLYNYVYRTPEASISVSTNGPGFTVGGGESLTLTNPTLSVLKAKPGQAYFGAFVSSAVPGLAGVTQVFTATNVNQLATNNIYDLPNVDSDEFYPLLGFADPAPVLVGVSPTTNNNFILLVDSPGMPCDGNTSIQMDCWDYIRYQPTNTPNSIMVTLGIVHWYIYATAAPSPTNSSVYVISSNQNAHMDSTITSATNFPFWIGIGVPTPTIIINTNN